MLPLTYQENYSRKSFRDLIQVFGNWKSPTELQLDSQAGTGSIHVIDVEDGLQVRIWDCQLATKLEIFRNLNTDPTDRTLTLVYYLTPGSFRIDSQPFHPGTINELWNNVLMSSDTEFRVSILPGNKLRCLSLNFTPEWLRDNVLAENEFKDHFFNHQLTHRDPVVLFESTSANEMMVIGSLFQNPGGSFGKFFLRSKALNLLTEFFIKLSNRTSINHGTTLYHENQMAAVKKKLIENLDKGLPDLKGIAAELCISESTMKRFFKRVYGKNIYEYFLEKKMIQARTLLDTNKHSVTEVAYTLGYDKVSHFISLFNRYYGVRPGSYQKLSLTK